MASSPDPDGRLTSYGNQLIEVHLWLREELDRLRADVDRFLDGSGERPRDLRAHCLTFCSALTRHHTGEDAGPFPVLATQVPELRPVIDELMRDHGLVTWALRRLERLLTGLGGDPRPDAGERVRAELDTLAALLETHFVYEEKRLVASLNSLDALTDDGSRPAFLLTADELDEPPP